MPRGFSEGFLKPKKDGKDSLSFQDKQKLIPANIRNGISIKLDGVDIIGSLTEVKLAFGTYSGVIARNNIDVQIPINPNFTPTQVFLTFFVDVSSRSAFNNVGQLFTYVGVISRGNIVTRSSFPANGSGSGGHTFGTEFSINSFTDTAINVRFNTNLDNVYPVSGTWVAIG